MTMRKTPGEVVLETLSEGPKSRYQIAVDTGLSYGVVGGVLIGLLQQGKAVYESSRFQLRSHRGNQ